MTALHPCVEALTKLAYGNGEECRWCHRFVGLDHAGDCPLSLMAASLALSARREAFWGGAEEALASAIHETCDWEHYLGHEPSERDDMLAASLIPALAARGYRLEHKG